MGMLGIVGEYSEIYVAWRIYKCTSVHQYREGTKYTHILDNDLLVLTMLALYMFLVD